MKNRTALKLWITGFCLVLGVAGCSKSTCQPGSCPTGEACNSGTGECQALESCHQDGDCQSGAECVGGICTGCANQTCSLALTHCDEQTQSCTPSCTSDDQCPSARPHCLEGACAACGEGSDCPSSAPFCSKGACVECTGNADCPSGTACDQGACSVPCGAGCPADAPLCTGTYCHACAAESDCASGQICRSGSCVQALPGNTCGNAVEVDLSAGKALLTGDLTGYPSEDGTRVGYFHFHVAQSGLLSATIHSERLSGKPYFESYFGGGCDARVESNLLPVQPVGVAPGDYWIEVGDSAPEVQPSAFTLTLELVPAPLPDGGSCFAPQPLEVPTQGTLSLSGTTMGAGNVNGCANGPTVTYAVRIPPRTYYTITGASDAGTLRLSLSDEPCADLGRTCAGPAYDGSPTLDGLTPLDAGTRFLALAAEEPLDYALDITTHPENPDSCALAAPLLFDGGTASIAFDPQYTQGGSGPSSCQAYGAPVFYRFTVGAGGASFYSDTLTGPDLGIGLNDACPGATTPVVCDVNGVLEAPYLSAGDYTVRVSSDWDAGVSFNLGPPYPPPANDTCSSPQTLDLTAQTSQTLGGQTRGAQAGDTDFHCGGTYGGSSTSRDLVYRLQLPAAPGHVRATVTPVDPGYRPVVQLQDACAADPNYTDNCREADGGTPVTVTHASPGSSGYLWVGGSLNTKPPASGPTFNGTVEWIPAPPNDVCSGATAISSGQTLTGDTTGAFTEPSDPCYFYGPSTFYAFTAPANGTATVTLTPSAGFDGALGVLTGGCTGYCYTFDQNPAGGAETTSVSVSRNTTYYLEVAGSLRSDVGAFTLTVQ